MLADSAHNEVERTHSIISKITFLLLFEILMNEDSHSAYWNHLNEVSKLQTDSKSGLTEAAFRVKFHFVFFCFQPVDLYF